MGRPQISGVRLIGIRLREKDIKQAKKIGAATAQPYQGVIRSWVAEKADATRIETKPAS